MEGYQGERDVTDKHPHTPTEAAMRFVEMYGQIDGEHHKAWVLDQVARALSDAPIEVREASWSDGTTELRYSLGTSPVYEAWVATMEACGGYDAGSPP